MWIDYFVIGSFARLWLWHILWKRSECKYSHGSGSGLQGPTPGGLLLWVSGTYQNTSMGVRYILEYFYGCQVYIRILFVFYKIDLKDVKRSNKEIIIFSVSVSSMWGGERGLHSFSAATRCKLVGLVNTSTFNLSFLWLNFLYQPGGGWRLSSLLLWISSQQNRMIKE